jgi:leader peptidase (prepilin peptidase)/N-methyltransferase
MIRALRRTTERTSLFLGDALACRRPERQHALVAWGMISGATWLVGSLAGAPAWPGLMLAGLYLFAVLAAVCAIDARFGIIPDSLVAGLAVGGLLQTFLPGQGEAVQRSFEAMLFFGSACLFRAAYRRVRGHDGLGFGDVKFATAGVLWVGIEGVPGLLLLAVFSALASLLILKWEGHELSAKQAISFGPHLAIGLWLAWVAGPLPFGAEPHGMSIY